MIDKGNNSRPLLPEDMDDDRELFEDLLNVVSGTECTGLIPSAPYTDYAVRSYSEIYDIPLSDDQTSGKPDDRK